MANNQMMDEFLARHGHKGAKVETKVHSRPTVKPYQPVTKPVTSVTEHITDALQGVTSFVTPVTPIVTEVTNPVTPAALPVTNLVTTVTNPVTVTKAVTNVTHTSTPIVQFRHCPTCRCIRVYASNAERQKAYRDRKREQGMGVLPRKD
jgi:hypothetical protein